MTPATATGSVVPIAGLALKSRETQRLYAVFGESYGERASLGWKIGAARQLIKLGRDGVMGPRKGISLKKAFHIWTDLSHQACQIDRRLRTAEL